MDYSFNTIADMRSSSYPTYPKTCYVLGYYTIGDGGGGAFFWDESSTADDNGGTVIKSDNMTTGRWVRIYDESIPLKAFGLKCDGLTEDTTSLKKLLESFSNENITITGDINEKCKLSGKVEIKHPNITFKDCYFYFFDNANDQGFLVTANDTTFYKCTIEGLKKEPDGMLRKEQFTSKGQVPQAV